MVCQLQWLKFYGGDGGGGDDGRWCVGIEIIIGDVFGSSVGCVGC